MLVRFNYLRLRLFLWWNLHLGMRQTFFDYWWLFDGIISPVNAVCIGKIEAIRFGKRSINGYLWVFYRCLPIRVSFQFAIILKICLIFDIIHNNLLFHNIVVFVQKCQLCLLLIPDSLLLFDPPTELFQFIDHMFLYFELGFEF